MTDRPTVEFEPTAEAAESVSPAELLMETAAAHFGVQADDLRLPGRQSQPITQARYCVMQLLDKETDVSRFEIGRLLDRTSGNIAVTLTNQQEALAAPHMQAHLDDIRTTFVNRHGGDSEFVTAPERPITPDPRIREQMDDMFDSHEREPTPRHDPPIEPVAAEQPVAQTPDPEPSESASVEYEPDPDESANMQRTLDAVCSFYGIDRHEVTDFSRNQRRSPAGVGRNIAVRIAKSWYDVSPEAIGHHLSRSKTQINAADNNFLKRLQTSPELQEDMRLLRLHLMDGQELVTKSALEDAGVETEVATPTRKPTVTYTAVVEREVGREETEFFAKLSRQDPAAVRRFNSRFGGLAAAIVTDRYSDLEPEVALPIAEEAVAAAGRTFIPKLHPDFAGWAEKVVANRINAHHEEQERRQRVAGIDPVAYLEVAYSHWEKAMKTKQGMKPLETRKAISFANSLGNDNFKELADRHGIPTGSKIRARYKELLVDRLENLAQLPWLFGKARKKHSSIPQIEPLENLLPEQHQEILDLTMQRLVKEAMELAG